MKERMAFYCSCWWLIRATQEDVRVGSACLFSRTPSLGEIEICAAADPVETAKAAGLRYVSDTLPGIARKRAGKHFSYIGLDGKPIRDPKELERIKKLGIPPSWTNVWICASPR